MGLPGIADFVAMAASRKGQDHLSGVRDIARQGSIFVPKPASRVLPAPPNAISGVALTGLSVEASVSDIRRGVTPSSTGSRSGPCRDIAPLTLRHPPHRRMSPRASNAPAASPGGLRFTVRVNRRASGQMPIAVRQKADKERQRQQPQRHSKLQAGSLSPFAFRECFFVEQVT